MSDNPNRLRTELAARSTPLRIAVLIKQVPVPETLNLGSDRRLEREGMALEMNPYCRRAVAKGVELAQATGGACTVVTLGPPSAEDVLREALAWGADSGLHLCDSAFAGSDTLATARTLVAALEGAGSFDLILLGRNSIDGETGQVGPEVAQLLDLPFASGALALEAFESHLTLDLETDDGFAVVEIDFPAVISVAERLCDPCKVDPAGRAAVSPDLIRRQVASELGAGPWGDAGSPTSVGAVRTMTHQRNQRLLRGPVEDQVNEAVKVLARRGALTIDGAEGRAPSRSPDVPSPAPTLGEVPSISDSRPFVGVIVEHDRVQVAQELVGAAVRLASEIGGVVYALCPAGFSVDILSAAGAHVVVELAGSRVPEDVADALIAWMIDERPWAILAPSTTFGREVAGRAASAIGAGLVGDAIALDVVNGLLIAVKPAFGGALVADISCRSDVQLATVRPGVLPLPAEGIGQAQVVTRTLALRGRVRVLSERRTDDVETLARASVVIGVGTGVSPNEYGRLSTLAAILGAELAATRKVTDKGWAPRARQVGITGRAISPRLYIAIGLSGKFNHMIGVRAAGSILAINSDPEALVFAHCDVGIVGDWIEVLPVLERALRHYQSELQGVSTVG